MNRLDTKLVDWLLSGDVGASSKCMANHLTGRPHDKSYPSDQDDFERCMGLLDTVPELRKKLSKMSAVSKQWAGLVKHWDTIEKMVRANDPESYELMKKILHPIEDADPNIIRFSDDMSIHFDK